jgi:hypothetical protein
VNPLVDEGEIDERSLVNLDRGTVQEQTQESHALDLAFDAPRRLQRGAVLELHYGTDISFVDAVGSTAQLYAIAPPLELGGELHVLPIAGGRLALDVALARLCLETFPPRAPLRLRTPSRVDEIVDGEP